jgi:glyceraldehyde 3-phosphate dehydrogenase
VIPEIKGTFDGFALRVPTPTVSMVYLVVQVKRETTKDEVNAIMRAAANGPMKRYVQYNDLELVSSDFKRSPYSSIFDSSLTGANGTLIQIAAWYDNEWGYSCRLADLTDVVLEKLPSEVA